MIAPMLTAQQQFWAFPHTLSLSQRVILAEFLEKRTLHVPPLELVVGIFNTRCGLFAFACEEAGF